MKVLPASKKQSEPKISPAMQVLLDIRNWLTGSRRVTVWVGGQPQYKGVRPASTYRGAKRNAYHARLGQNGYKRSEILRAQRQALGLSRSQFDELRRRQSLLSAASIARKAQKQAAQSEARRGVLLPGLPGAALSIKHYAALMAEALAGTLRQAAEQLAQMSHDQQAPKPA